MTNKNNCESLATIVIPARWGSSRFPGKPLHRIAGKFLIQWVWERAKNIKNANGVIIATDDERISQASQNFGAKVVMTLVKHESGTDRIAEAVRNIESDIIINLQGDEPLIDTDLVENMIIYMQENPTCEMISAANKITSYADYKNPNIVKVTLDNFGNAMSFSRSPIPHGLTEADFRNADNEQSTSEINDGLFALRHQGIYGYRKKFLMKFTKLPQANLERIEKLEQMRALQAGTKIKILLTPPTPPGVDTPSQAVEIEKIIAR